MSTAHDPSCPHCKETENEKCVRCRMDEDHRENAEAYRAMGEI